MRQKSCKGISEASVYFVTLLDEEVVIVEEESSTRHSDLVVPVHGFIELIFSFPI